MALAEALLDAGLVDRENLRRAQSLTTETGRTLSRVLLDLGLIADDDMLAILAERFDIPRVDEPTLEGIRTPISEINPRFLRSRMLVPFELDNDSIGLALTDPTDEISVNAIEFATGKPALPMLATRSDIQAVLDRIYWSEKAAGKSEINHRGGDLTALREASSDAPAIRYLDEILKQAVKRKASDIHLEHDHRELRVRLRLDGVLVSHDRLHLALGEALLGRIKVMAGMDIAERRLPQDGRMSITVLGQQVDCRVASSPGVAGENLVVRLLARNKVRPELKQLGFQEQDQKMFERALARSEGLVLVTGPTGSGKTTSLYAALGKVDTGSVKIATIEDPVEYWLDGITQVEVNSAIGRTFAGTLRAFLRQDPDVILVGEIRDEETARIAVQAALTGHLVLSTLHTSRAAAAVTRLLDMGTEDYLLASTLGAIVAQRLVRVLCAACRRENSECKCQSLPLVSEVGPFEPVGCKLCDGTGYKGRTAIAEVLVIGEEIRTHIRKRSSEAEIEQTAVNLGMSTMRENGLRAVVAGVTTIDEVFRVTSGDKR